MANWFVSRHAGAREWAQAQSLKIDRWTAHLRIEDVAPGDIVMGTIPLEAAASLCSKGARVFALCMDLSADLRGQELSASLMTALHCRLVEFRVSRADDGDGSEAAPAWLRTAGVAQSS